MNREEFKKAYACSDDFMERIDLVFKLFHGKEVRVIDSEKGLPINDKSRQRIKVNDKNIKSVNDKKRNI